MIARNKIISSVILTIFLLIATITPCSATQNQADWAEGLAIYRDGAFVDYTWHAGIGAGENIKDGFSILHIGGYNQGVTYCSYNEFLNVSAFNNNTFKGYYRSVEGFTENKNLILSTAMSLTNYDIGYTPLRQLKYDVDDCEDNVVAPENIQAIRCDGVVEYCYEVNECRVFGDDEHWNISIPNEANKQEHEYANVTPETQSKQYMVNMLGDINCDATVSAEDARLALRASIGSELLNDYQVFVCDVDGNGLISAEDSRLILRYSTGLESIFPGDPANEN